MNITKTILSFIKKRTEADTAAIDTGYCPNCWGRQEYGGNFYEAMKAKNVDVNEKDPTMGWVQAYADKHLSDIRLIQKDDALVCDKCKVTYRPEK